MLIHIDGAAAADAISSSPTGARSHAAIENLLLAHYHGEHILSLLPSDAAVLYATSWSPRAQRALGHVDETYAQIAGLRSEIGWSLELGLGPAFNGDSHDVAGKKLIRASLHAFEKPHTAACAALLGENLTDADFFRELGLMSRAVRRWEGLEMIHEPRGTGGSTFAPELRQAAERGRILLAIADSDARHPKSDVGGTYHKLRSEADGRPAYQRARPLPTRTVEALVPLSVYREAFTFLHDHGDQRLGDVARLEQLLRSAPADVIRYAHFKDGITLHQIENPRTEAEGLYWRGIAEKAKRDQCTRPTPEQCDKREECRCYVVDKLGDKAIADVVDWMKTRKSKKDLASRFRLSDSPELAALGDEVLAWGLAPSPILT